MIMLSPLKAELDHLFQNRDRRVSNLSVRRGRMEQGDTWELVRPGFGFWLCHIIFKISIVLAKQDLPTPHYVATGTQNPTGNQRYSFCFSVSFFPLP